MSKHIWFVVLLASACSVSHPEIASDASTSTDAEADTGDDGDTPDVNVPDVNRPDTDIPDVSSPDTGDDSGEPDAGEPDASEPDAGEPDASEPDAGEPDASEPDAGEPDAGEPDAGEPDAGEPDASEPDAGPVTCLEGSGPIVEWRFSPGGRFISTGSMNATLEGDDMVSDGAVRVPGSGNPRLFTNAAEAEAILDAIDASGELTIEAWVEQSNGGLGGPARIVTCSYDGGTRAFTLAQDSDELHLRIHRSTTNSNGRSDTNGYVTLPSAFPTPGVAYMAATYSESMARASLGSVDRGALRLNVATRSGAMERSSSDNPDRCGVGNEFADNRRFSGGVIHYVAIYDRALSRDELECRQMAGDPDGDD